MAHPTSALGAISNIELFREFAFVGSRWVSKPKAFPVYDSADGGCIANICDLSVNHVIQAVETAQAAFRQYRETSGHQRSRFLHRFAERILVNSKDPSTLLTLENGKTVDEAKGEVEEHIVNAVAKGAQLPFRGYKLNHIVDSQFDGGFHTKAAILVRATPNIMVVLEGIFGLLALVFKSRIMDKVMQMANDTEFGLAGYFFTKDLGIIWHIAGRLEVGIVGVNTGTISTTKSPFVSVKESGLGEESITEWIGS